MKQILLIIFVVSTMFANPMWYYNLPTSKANVYLGFGSGLDESHARQEALNDISSQISVHVNTSMKQRQKIQNGSFDTSEEFTAEQTSQAMLYDYKLIKSEYRDGKYFVAIEYENIPSLDKFINKIKSSYTLQVLKNEKQNGYLKDTKIAKKLRKSLGKDINFSLLRKDQKWYIKYKTILQVLDKKDFARFFSSIASQKLEINTNKKRNILYNEQRFFFKVKSSESGYASILSVYEDGTVSTLMRNISIEKNTLTHMPDEEFETIPEAGLMQKGIETYDLYVLMFSKKRVLFDSYAYADEELINEEKYKNFDELIEFLDDKDFTTLKVVTKPRM